MRGSELTGRVRMRADVVVVGTGAGGAVVAKELAEGGLRVVMLEEGELLRTVGLHRAPARRHAAAVPRRRRRW